MDILNLLGLDYLKVEYKYERTLKHVEVPSEYRHSVEQYVETDLDYKNRQFGSASSSCNPSPWQSHSRAQSNKY